MTTPTFTFCVGDDTGGGNDLIRLKKGKIKGDKGKEIILSNKGEYSLKVGRFYSHIMSEVPTRVYKGTLIKSLQPVHWTSLDLKTAEQSRLLTATATEKTIINSDK
jgi:hypothetical protein